MRDTDTSQPEFREPDTPTRPIARKIETAYFAPKTTELELVNLVEKARQLVIAEKIARLQADIREKVNAGLGRRRARCADVEGIPDTALENAIWGWDATD